jgi:hypothetical protein
LFPGKSDVRHLFNSESLSVIGCYDFVHVAQAIPMISGKEKQMFVNRLLSSSLLMFGLTIAVSAQNRSAYINVSGPHAKMTIASVPPQSFTRTEINDSSLITIFSNLAARYPKGAYWCCQGYNVMGSNSGLGEQWMGAAFTPKADRTVTKIAVAAGYSQQGPNGMVVSINDDNNGVPGQALQTWNVSGLPRFGDCCALVVVSDASGVPVSAGKQYWIVLSTNSNETDTVDGWNVNDTDQVDSEPLASYTSGKWTAFPSTPGVGFAVLGN